MKQTIQAFIALSLLTSIATAADGPTLERGKELFNSTQLGSNGKSCATCHPGGKGLEDAAALDGKKLTKITNQCIVKALKGTALADDSLDLTSLVMYQNSLGTAKAK